MLSNRALPSSQSQKASVLKVAIFETPLGDIVSIFSPKGLCLLEFLDQASLPRKLKSVQAFYQSPFDWQMSEDQKQLQTALESYFKGQVKDFDVDIDWIGTDFQKAVWQVLTKIGYGQTISYKEEAAMLGNPGAIRAVGTANGQNKISIVVPCHRVIGHDGKLVGYGGGLARKRYLLDLESDEISQSALLSPI